VSTPAIRSRQLEALERLDVQVNSNPAVMYVESVRGCPYTCVMCMARGTKPVKMPPELLEKLEPFYPDLEVLAIHGFGEPLLADLDYFVAKATEHDIVLHMNTTGFFMSRRVCELLLEARLSIRFSIHAGTSETYRRVMGQDFRKVIDNIKYLTKSAEQSGKDHDFWFSYVVMKETLDDIEDFLRLTRDCGVSSVRFMRLAPNKQSIRGFTLEDRDFRFRYFEQFNRRIFRTFHERYPRYQKLADELGIQIEFGSMESKNAARASAGWLVNGVSRRIIGKKLLPLLRPRGHCLAPWLGQLIVRQTGEVKLCCKTSYLVGNLHEETIGEMWNGDRMERIRRPFSEGRIPRECGYCPGYDMRNYPNNSFPEAERRWPESLPTGGRARKSDKAEARDTEEQPADRQGDRERERVPVP